MRRTFLLLVLMGMVAASGAFAQFRTIPQNAKFARVGNAQPLPFVQLGSTVLKLAPGGVIYDENNRTILHGALPAGAQVAYIFELGGDISRIYILTAQELAQINNKQ